MSAPNDIIFYHYAFSPYAHRVLDYLALRGIDYAQCIQPPMLPRPDLELLNVKYRRIPLMAIGNHVYADTRLILQKLEEKFPYGRLASTQADQRGVERLLSRWAVDGGLFTRATQLLPPELPLLRDPKFQKDRAGLMGGRDWSEDGQKKGRPEAVVHMRDCFEDLEHGLLADGRDWILKTSKPSLADIEIVWIFDWLTGMQGALPTSVFSETTYPKTYAWIKRYKHAVGAAAAKAPKPMKIKGAEAATQITAHKPSDVGAGVDDWDPLGLREGATVAVMPTDYGFSHRDVGRLVKLTKQEVAIEVETVTPGKTVWLHCPRWGFRIQEQTGRSNL